MYKKTFITFFILLFFITPFVVFGEVKSSGGIWKDTTCNQSESDPCGFCDAVKVARNIINYLFQIAIPLAVGMIVWGAIRIMTAGGSDKNLEEGKNILKYALIGLSLALGAWLIVGTILHAITGNPDFTWNEIKCST